MKWNAFLDQYKIQNDEIITHTSMDGGKWNIPEKDLPKFYKKLDKYLKKHQLQIVERLGDIHPFIIDIDLKYKDSITERQYTDETIQQIVSYLWNDLADELDLEDHSKYGEIWVMEKEKPYPCANSKKYQFKDGIHIALPCIKLKNETYRQIVNLLKDSKTIESILKNTCSIEPSNMNDGSILDAGFSSWHPYGCSKENETPYQLVKVYNVDEDNSIHLIDQDIFEDCYSESLDLMKKLSVCYHKEENVQYKDHLHVSIDKQLKIKKLTNNKMVAKKERKNKNQYYVDNNQVINRYQIVEEEELKFINNLVTCLSKKRAEDYGTWIQVGLCLKNINPDLLDAWKGFSSLSDSYDEEVCDKKWKSINDNHQGGLSVGSLYYWAKSDNNEKYYKIMKENLRGIIEKSINYGPDAHHLIGLVIAKYYENQFICIDINDEWYYFNGVRWKRTLKGNALKKKIHNDIYNIYHEYQLEYKEKRDNEEEGTTLYQVYSDNHDKCLSFQKKLLQENYVCTVINALKHLFYKENIMEEFDMNVDLIGFENGIYDLKECVFREGRPEDYVTMSNKMILPIDPEWEMGDDLPIPESPISLDDLVPMVSGIEDYDELYEEMELFIRQVVPSDDMREYLFRFISKCLSGKNKEEGFYIWTGSGGNGKSKLVELISLCFGDYYCNLPIALLTQKRKASGAASPELARTKGKRFVVMQEPGTKEKLNIGEMKEITGNDKIQARGLFKEPFEFRPQFKLIMMTNELPIIESDDDGTWRRVEAVPFISRFVDPKDVDESQHKYLKNTSLQEDLPYWMIPFMCRLLLECREYYKGGIHIPKAVTDKTKQYRNANDLVGQWIEENCEEHDFEESSNGDRFAPSEFAELYPRFTDWCDEEEIKNRPDRQAVRESLKKWQEKSKYGLMISKKKSDKMRNGTENAPRFNLVVMN